MSESILPIPEPSAGLSAARPAESAATLCQGDRIWLRVHDRSGIVTAATDAGPLLEALETDAGPCGNVLVEPGHLRRELLSPRGTVLEDCFALPRLPGARLQWSTPDNRAFELRISLRLPGDGEAAVEGSRLTLTPDGRDGPTTVLRMHPEPRSLDWGDQDGMRRLTLVLAIPAGGRAHLAVGSAERPAVAAAAVDSLDRFGPQTALRDGWVSELAENHLRTRTGLTELDDGLEWAKVRASGLDRPSLGRLQAQLGAALFREAERTLDALASPLADEFGTALGRLLLWTGDHDAPARRRRTLERWIEERREHGAGSAARHTALVEALEGLGYPDEAEAVRRLPTRVEGGTMSLPMAGGTAVTRPAAPDPESVWLELRETAERCSGGFAGGDDDDPGYALIRILLEKLLGARPEAGLGRLELSPAFPEHLTSFQVEGIRAGRGGLDFRMDRDGGRHRFLFSPTRGAMPVNVIFQPSVVGRTIRESRVDGEPAELDWTTEAQRTTPRLQLPIDGERTVEFVVE